MISIRPCVHKRITQLYSITVIRFKRSTRFVFRHSLHNFWIISIVPFQTFLPLLFLPIRWHLVQNFNLIVCRFYIMRRTLLNLQSHVRIILCVFSKPDSAEMTPTKLLDCNVSFDKYLAKVKNLTPHEQGDNRQFCSQAFLHLRLSLSLRN